MITRQKVNNSMYVTKGSPPFDQRAKSALLMGGLTAYRYGNASQYFMKTIDTHFFGTSGIILSLFSVASSIASYICSIMRSFILSSSSKNLIKETKERVPGSRFSSPFPRFSV